MSGGVEHDKKNEIYKCEVCGNVVEIIEIGGGVLVCCGQDMKLFEEQTAEKEGKEKHVPVVEVDGNKVNVKVGSVEHPMEEGHYIEQIEILKDKNVIAAKQLSPGDKPFVEFCLETTEGITARALCNVHGLWVG